MHGYALGFASFPSHTFFHECMLQCDCENATADEVCSAMATSFEQITPNQTTGAQTMEKQPHIASSGGKGQSSNLTQPTLGENSAWSRQTVRENDRNGLVTV